MSGKGKIGRKEIYINNRVNNETDKGRATVEQIGKTVSRNGN